MKKQSSDTASDRRDQLVRTAIALFYRDGLHATGIDTIVAEAGVAKMTLYKHFKTKEQLILAALRLVDEQWRTWFVSRVDELAARPREKLLAVFDALGEWFAGQAPVGAFRGCPFINGAAEYAEVGHPVHRVACEHKHAIRRQLVCWATEAGFEAPDQLAASLDTLAAGAIVMSFVAGHTTAAQDARRAAACLVSHARTTG